MNCGPGWDTGGLHLPAPPPDNLIISSLKVRRVQEAVQADHESASQSQHLDQEARCWPLWSRQDPWRPGGGLHSPRPGESDSNPGEYLHQVRHRPGKLGLTASQAISSFLYIQASKVSDKLSELLIVMDSMDIEDEEEGEDKEVVSTDEDSGLDNSEENYMDIEIFA